MQKLEQYLKSWIKTIVAIVLLTTLALIVTKLGEQHLQREAERNLSSLIEVVSTGLHAEYRHMRVYTRFMAQRPEIIEAARLLMLEPRSPADLIDSPGQKIARQLFSPLLDHKVYQGFFIIARDNTNLASSRDANVGTISLLREQGLLLAQAWAGKTLISLPQTSDVPLPDANGVLRELSPTMFVVTPIRGSTGAVTALLALRVDPALTLFRILESGNQNDSGESYLFDRHGVMLSESRFTTDLWNSGRLASGTPSFGNLRLTIPGSDRLTDMAHAATDGFDGVNAHGYIDYRGIPVVGAWRWLDELAMGVAVESDRDVVYEGLLVLRAAVYGTTAAAVVLIFAVTFLSRKQQEALRHQVLLKTRALRDEKQRLDSLFEEAPNGLITLDESDRITRFSACARQVFGYSEDTMLGRPLADLFAEPLPAAAQSGALTHVEINGLSADGILIPMELSLSTTLTERGSFSLAIVRDISESKRMENAMRDEIRLRKAAEQRQRQLLDAAGEGIFGIDQAGVITFINPAGAHLLGYAPNELIGKSLTEGSTHNPPLCDGKCALGSRSPYTESRQQTVLTRSDGMRFEAEYLCTPLVADGQAFGGVVVFSDISVRKRTEQSLLLAENVFRHITEGVLVTDAEGRILRVNRALCEMVGYSEEEIVGLARPPYSSGEHAPVFYRQMWDTLKREGSWEGEIWNRRKSGELFPTWQTIVAVTDADGVTGRFVSVTRDITTQRRSERRIHRLAYFDNLTALPNRELFHDRFEHAIQRARRLDNKLALLFLDLDRFKNVNDSLGHPVGDQLLRAVSERLRHLVRGEDTIARLGGDEFTILLESTQDEEAISHVAAKVVDGLSRPFSVDQHTLHIGTSVGISRFPDDGDDVTTLIKHADTAMYQAKAAGRSTFQFYSQGLSSHTSDQVLMENNLHRAVRDDEFLLHYQPQYAGDGRIVGVEALIRWQDPSGTLVSPDAFVPLAEENGLIVVIGEWVLRTACTQMRTWLDHGAPDMRISVNLSGAQIIRGDIAKTVADVLAQTGLPARNLELEVTETFVMDNVENTVDILSRLRDLGVSIAIDDFGTGHSSLANLKRLPVDTLKIDRAFVHDVPHDPDDVAIARAIIALGRQLHMSTVAEGVETVAQKTFLADEGCDTFQGFLFSRPLAAHAVEQLWQPSARIKHTG